MRKGNLETWLHAFYLNEGVLVTPFHTMLLMCPATTDSDAARHDEVFARFVETALAEGAVKP
jgi:glutamate-1-semialdehyde 2,1-aminomutase